ncbi:hypothetical protein [Pedosphaera parvula]|uniref:hypothetical protein n=1 Tax=Pedosphaera parvula TaxID=1032527 RepID=UPI00123724CB|nr:hypothetical protein [Pedosphaera parvula]
MKERHSNKPSSGRHGPFAVTEIPLLGHDRIMETKRSILKKLSARIRQESCFVKKGHQFLIEKAEL